MQNTVWERIEQARGRWNVLEHPFYVRWSAGELTAEELARYSGQYRHAVAAIADASNYLAEQTPDDPGLASHAREESEHVALWDRFVDAIGGDADAAPSVETRRCAEEWSRRDGSLAALARLYAIESGQPAISETKLAGLRDHYGVDGGPGTLYFSVHRGRDHEHAAEARQRIEALASAGEEATVVDAAEAAFRANWELLDGVG